MIRIYDENRNDRISNNVTYTDNPLLFNLNDWVIIKRGDVEIDTPIHPYVYLTKYEELDQLDDQYEIIICTNEEQLQKLVLNKLENKIIYLLKEMSDKQIESSLPALVINSFTKESQIKVNHRNLFISEDKLGYSLQVNKLFYYETYAFLKLKLQNNSLIYISSEIECFELYTNIGVNEAIDISGLEPVDSNIVEFTISDRFNKYNVVSNLVIDFDNLEISPTLQHDFRVNYLSFVKKAYLQISGVRNPEEIKSINGKKFKLEAGKLNEIVMESGDIALKDTTSQAQILLRNYIIGNPGFKTNIKRQKRTDSIDESTRLIIIYDPNDRGFINVIDRTNSYEIAINKLFSFEQIEVFASQYANQIGISSENIIYLLDDSVDNTPNDIYVTSGLSIKNSIRHKDAIYNFTNIKMSKVSYLNQLMFISNIEYDKENDLYEIIIPDQFVGKNIFIKLNDEVSLYEAINSKTNRIGLHATFFSEVLNVSGPIEIQIAVIDNNIEYTSNKYSLISDTTVKPNYDLNNMVIYTVVNNIDYTSVHLQKIKDKYPNAVIHILNYQNTQNSMYIQFIKDTFDKDNMSYDEYVGLYPLYLESLGYKSFSYIANGSIHTENSLMLEIDSNILNIRTVISNELQVYIPNKINYVTMHITDYKRFFTQQSVSPAIGVKSQVMTVEQTNPSAVVIDFIHEFSPWDCNNSQVFETLTNKGLFINAEIISKLEGNSNRNYYPVSVNKLIMRNNNLLNIGKRQMKLSIIITTYGNEDAIYDTLKYIVYNISLAPRDFEILIFDDCSKDDTIGMINKFFTEHPHINNTVRVNPRNMRYPGFGANSGIRIARGKYVHIVDGDDKVLNNIYSILNRDLLDEDVISFGHYNYDVTRGEYIQGRYYSFNEFTDSFPYEKSKKEFKMLQANVTHWNKFFKTSFLRENSLYYLENQLVQDSAFLTDVYYCKPTVRHIPEIGYVYHIGHESVSSGRKGYKLFVDFVNANMKRTPLVDSFFPQYTYTMKRFMIYDEIKDEELESIVDLLFEKYATNYRINDIEFFNKGQLLYKMMHNLIINKEYNKIRKFLKLTEEFKVSSEYLDSKYYDLFLGINKQNVIGHFIVNIKIFASLYKEQIAAKNINYLDQFILYYNAVKPQIENEIKVINNVYIENGYFYQEQYNYLLTNFQQVLDYVYKLDLDLVPIKYQFFNEESTKTSKKIFVVKNSNTYLRNQLLRIDKDATIIEIAGNDNELESGLANIHAQYKDSNTFAFVIDGSSEIDFNNLYLIYNNKYSSVYSLIKLTDDEPDDMFRVANRYLINIKKFTEREFSRMAIFKANDATINTVKIELDDHGRIFEHVYVCASGYGNIDTENMELLNRLFHTSKVLRSIEYDERKRANMCLFDFNIVEGE
ncbi:glycosyltransferase family 2 protein [Mollicutes bacterium LVI A0078]|nr:glycosyltransferase family 2 protein [Mollicutes bacterium LVI A0075]WOO91225.1 glycosyltransferase family 2 protein [Mollicutes bacterium LVI A0078]